MNTKQNMLNLLFSENELEQHKTVLYNANFLTMT